MPALLLGVLLVALLLRNAGLYPSVFSDEYTYSKLSRLTALSEASIPGYVYLKIFGITRYCGDGFLACARIINAVLFVLAAPFIFLISRSVAERGASLWVTALALLGPVNSYTAYFMPESAYFLSFWAFCWYLLRLDATASSGPWLAAGTLYAVSALIKPHSMFFLPAVLVYMAFLFWRTRRLLSRAAVKAMASFILGALVAKFGIGFALAGPAGLTLFGSLYGSIATSTALDLGKYAQLLPVAFESLKGNAVAVALMYGLPLVVAGTVMVNARSARSAPAFDEGTRDARLERVACLALAVVLNLICVVALFTASVGHWGPQEVYRLHMRYYNFALPLLYVVAAGAIAANVQTGRWARYGLGAALIAVILYASATRLAPYVPNFVDSPEISGLQVDRLHFAIAACALMLTSASWMRAGGRGLRAYLYVALPLLVVISSYHISLRVMANRLTPDVYDTAGILVKRYLAPEDISKVVVVGADPGGLYRVLFHLDNAGASLDVVASDATYDLAKAPPDRKWALVVGRHAVAGGESVVISEKGFNLVRIAPPR